MVRKGRYTDESVIRQRFLLTLRRDGVPTEYEVQVAIDLSALAKRLGTKAILSKSGKACAQNGTVEVKVVKKEDPPPAIPLGE